ncbi:MAG TPA: MFS transporter [Caldilineaceae bacterium]|nr:MFS transporter [Caldilineaceae bacterium]
MQKLTGLSALYLFLITQAFSMIGSRMTAVGLGLWLFAETGNTTPLLLTVFFTELPGMLLGSVAGALVDRAQRNWVLLLADTGLALCSLLLLAAIGGGWFRLAVLYGVALVQGVLVILQSPAKDASLALMIPPDRRDRINGIQQMLFPFAGVVAPALAGLVYTIGGIGAVFVADFATFLVAAGAIFVLNIPQPALVEEEQQRATLLADLRAGFQFVATEVGLLTLLLFGTVTNYLYNGSLELTVPYVVTVTGSEVATGLVLMASSVGAFLGGGIIAARSTVRRRVQWILGGSLLTAIMYLLYGVVNSPWLLAATLFLLMLPLPMGGALLTSLLQTRVPPVLQGRVFALFGQLSFVGSTLSFLSIGPLVDRVLEPAVGQAGWYLVAPLVGVQAGAGMRLLMIATGLLLAVATSIVWLIPAVRKLDTV